jgi:pyrroloquinoline quinone biosynthesis protein D
MTETPKLHKRARLRYDVTENRWVLLWPERGVLLNESATAIVRLCDGSRTVEEIVDQLANDWSAPREQVEPDVRAFLERVERRGLLE